MTGSGVLECSVQNTSHHFMNVLTVMKQCLCFTQGTQAVPVTLAQQCSWPKQAADIFSSGLKLQLEMQTDICETSLCVNPVLQRFCLSRCQSVVFVRCCMPANLYAHNVL